MRVYVNGLLEGATLLTLDTEQILQGYLECALWASSDYDVDGNLTNESMDDLFEPDDFSPEAVMDIQADIANFVLLVLKDKKIGREGLREYLRTQSSSQLGHDLFLTRNGHGAGFWDRGLKDLGDLLTGHAKSMGSQDVYSLNGEVHV